MDATKVLLVITSVFQCNGVSLRRQLQHIAESHAESQGITNEVIPSRRHFYNYDPRELSAIVGAPSIPSHLPEAEPVLPGHTLIKPALGMLKSSVKFPHRDLEDGSGVYGNMENIGIKYDSKNERVLYSGFRRMPTDGFIVRNNGRIYLKRIYTSKQPVYNNEFSRRKIFKKSKIKKLLGGLRKKANQVRKRLKKYWNLLTTFKKKKSKKAKSVLRSNIEKSQSKDHKADKENLIVINNQDTEKHKRDKEIENGLWKFQNTFNHVAIDQTAPDITDLLPTVPHDKTRQWWFFNEGDLHRPLQAE